MWKIIKNIFDVVVKKSAFKSLQIIEEEKEDVLNCDQQQLQKKSMIKSLKKKNVKSRKHI
jgi:hypothetical protein